MVEECYFGNNPLISMALDAFKGVTNIKIIGLADDSISNVENMSISNTVVSLNMANNDILYVSPFFIASLPNLKSLIVNQNKLTNITLLKLLNLLELNLHDNARLKIFIIDAEISGLPELKTLDLLGTSLESFTYNTFLHIPSQKTLDLIDTFITHIDDISSIYGIAPPTITIILIDCGVAKCSAKHQGISYPSARCMYPQIFQG